MMMVQRCTNSDNLIFTLLLTSLFCFCFFFSSSFLLYISGSL